MDVGIRVPRELRDRSGLRRLAFAVCFTQGCSLAPTLFAAHDPARVDDEIDAIELLDLELEKLLQIRVNGASGFIETVDLAAQTVHVIDRDQIETMGWQTLTEALASLPGLQTRNDRNFDYLSARGINVGGDYNSRFLLLLNGVRINDALYGAALTGTESPIGLEQVERIEYFAGPGSALHGANALLGVINVVTWSDYAVDAGRAQVWAGDYGQRRAAIHWSGGDAVRFMINASGSRREGETQYYAAFDTPEQNNGRAEDLDYDDYQKLLVGIRSSNTTLDLAYSNRETGIPTASFNQRFNDARARTRDRFVIATLRHDRALTERLELQTSLSGIDYHYQGEYAYAADDAGINLDTARALSFEVDARVVHALNAHDQWLLGVSHTQAPRLDQANRQLDGSDPSLDISGRRHLSSAYGSWKRRWSSGWMTTAGLRLDHDSVRGNALNPRLSAVYPISASSSYRLAYAEAFRPPNELELGYNLGAEGSGQTANYDLQAEQMRMFEFAWSGKLPITGFVDTTVFWNRVRHPITQSINEQGDLQYDNSGRFDSYGLTLGVRAVHVADWEMSGSVTVQGFNADQRQQDPWNAPELLGKLVAQRSLWAGGLVAGLSAYCSSSVQSQQGRVDGFARFDVTMTTNRLPAGLEASARIANLFDSNYDHATGPEHRQDAIQQDGRNLLLGLRKRF